MGYVLFLCHLSGSFSAALTVPSNRNKEIVIGSTAQTLDQPLSNLGRLWCTLTLYPSPIPLPHFAWWSDNQQALGSDKQIIQEIQRLLCNVRPEGYSSWSDYRILKQKLETKHCAWGDSLQSPAVGVRLIINFFWAAFPRKKKTKTAFAAGLLSCISSSFL